MILEIEELDQSAGVAVFHRNQISVFEETINSLQQKHFSFNILWYSYNPNFLGFRLPLASPNLRSPQRIFLHFFLNWVHIFQIVNNLPQNLFILYILKQFSNNKVKNMRRFNLIIILLDLISREDNHIMLW